MHTILNILHYPTILTIIPNIMLTPLCQRSNINTWNHLQGRPIEIMRYYCWQLLPGIQLYHSPYEFHLQPQSTTPGFYFIHAFIILIYIFFFNRCFFINFQSLHLCTILCNHLLIALYLLFRFCYNNEILLIVRLWLVILYVSIFGNLMY